MAATEVLRQPRATDGCTAICAHRKPSPWKFLLRQVSVWSEDAGSRKESEAGRFCPRRTQPFVGVEAREHRCDQQERPHVSPVGARAHSRPPPILKPSWVHCLGAQALSCAGACASSSPLGSAEGCRGGTLCVHVVLSCQRSQHVPHPPSCVQLPLAFLEYAPPCRLCSELLLGPCGLAAEPTLKVPIQSPS